MTLPVPDVDRPSPEQLGESTRIYEELRLEPLKGFSAIGTDMVRRDLNDRLCIRVLGVELTVVENLTRELAIEATLRARH